MVPFRFRGRWGGGGGGGGGGVIAWQLSSLSLVVVLGPQLTGSRRDQEEGGGAGPSTYRAGLA